MVGILLWGIPTGVLFSLVAAFVKPETFVELQKFDFDIFKKYLLLSVPFFSICGLFLGLIMFRIAQKFSNDK